MTYHARQDETTEWLNYLQPEGLVAGPNVLRERGLTPLRQSRLDTIETAQALNLDPDSTRDGDKHYTLQDPWTFFESVLGWPTTHVAGSATGPAVPSKLTMTVPEHETLLTPDMAVLWNGEAPENIPAQALVMLHPTLDADARNQFPASEWEASPHQRLERLLRETNVGVGILVTRNSLRLVYAPRGETAGWLTWPLAALGRVEGRPMLAGLKLCLGRNAFFTGSTETRLRTLLEASRAAQNEVSEKLSGQVLGALHELLRGLHRAAPDKIEQLAQDEPQHLYEGLLTCLMRLVFLLYAEDRDLLPSSTDPKLKALWENGYSIKTLYARLLTDEALNPDTMDERRGAWGQMLAVFRVVHEGYPGWVTGRGGKLFDPDRFPFIEGRERGTTRDDAMVLPVSDGVILRILHGLMTIEGRSPSGEKIRERLSYRSLDVESIGSVYETVMGFTTKRADETMIALRDEKKLPTFIGLDTLLAQKPNDRQKVLKDEAIKLSAKQAKAVKDATDVPSLIEAFGTLIDDRASPRSTPLGKGAPYLQPTEERRRSGSHYTPRSLTEPIVRHALEPAFARLGEKASPEDVLSLKVLDPACGSGAFLVEACRQIGARLEQAWNMHGAEKPVIPADEDEALHARRLVAQKCLYGVDRNPMAVDLARLSLWLATLAREHEFTFLDHALKAGDSLVGLTRAEISAAHWDSSKPGLPLFGKMIKEAVEKAREGREAIRTAGDDVLNAAQAARYSRVQDASEPARIVGDAVIASFFSSDKPKDREAERQKIESWVASTPPKWDLIKERANTFQLQKKWRPFHWEVEFPEVFSRTDPGFDSIIGNPPFLGVTGLGASAGTIYTDMLRHYFHGAGGKTDIIGFFVRRCFAAARAYGTIGIISTKTLAQGDTRRSGLTYVCANGGSIYRVKTNIRWPGEASVIVTLVHITKAKINSAVFNGNIVECISPLLQPGIDGEPSPLNYRPVVAFLGAKPQASGFVIREDENCTLNETNSQYIRGYLRGEFVNDLPEVAFPEKILDLNRIEKRELEQNPNLYEYVKARVFEQRLGQSPSLSKNWWKFGFYPRLLQEVLTRKELFIITARTSNTFGFTFCPPAGIINDKVIGFRSDDAAVFAVLQSRVHEVWARILSSTRTNDLQYTPSDCFETFPFLKNFQQDDVLRYSGQNYFAHRAKLMIATNEGMTKTYNRFHDADEQSDAIKNLRKLHDELDHSVLRAYGWDDLAQELSPEFLTAETEDDQTYQGRYFWKADGRDKVLARLLALNAERHAEEVSAEKGTKGKGRTQPKGNDTQTGFNFG